MKVLFPDTSAIASMEGIELRQGEICKHKEPVLSPEYPWEGTHTYVYGSVLKRGRGYRMWYQSYDDGGGFFVNYARSGDGLQWGKPLIRNFNFQDPGLYPTVAVGEKIQDFCSRDAQKMRCKTNIVSTYHIPSVIYDAKDRERRFKLFGFTDAGYCAAFSRDGFHFKEYEKNPVIPLMKFPNPATGKTWFSDVSPVMKDEKRDRFVAFVKTYSIDKSGRTRRCVGFSESRDFISWSEPETVWTPDAGEDKLAVGKGFQWADFYGLCGFNYGELYLGLLWVFYIDHEIKQGTHDGKLESYLVVSPDGKQWKRISDTPFIPYDESQWDSCIITTANSPVFERDKILLYYGGANFRHGTGSKETPIDHSFHRVHIGLASVRKDGFVYAYSNNGSLTTRLLKGERGRLTLNLDAAKGYALVDVIKNGKSMKSFKVAGVDSINHTIRNKVEGDFSLRFFLSNAKLYSFEVE